MFTHLHLHTDFSLLDGVIQIPPLVEKLKTLGMTSCAITDHGNLYGAYKFYSALNKEGIKPIIGSEIYIAPRTMDEKVSGIDNKYYHMTLLAKNLEGYKNLIKIVSKAHIDGYYYKPRIDYEYLKDHTAGLISLSGCFRGVVLYPLYNGNEKLALENLEKYHEIFKDDFYLEVQRFNTKEEIEPTNKLISYSQKYNIPLVATCDSHFINREDVELQEILWAIRDGKTIDDPTRSVPFTDQTYVKSEDEMLDLYKDIPECVTNTSLVDKKIENYEIKFGRVEPKFLSLPKKITPKEYLKKLTFEGVPEKYGKLTKDLEDRLNYELELISSKGYDDYFLIVGEFIKFCRDNGIVIGIRGSACGSAVAYCIGITHVEPISWELYFERFLNPERKSPPDIDIDIADKGREKVLEYVIKVYGADNVKQIGTFSKLQTRQAIRDIARVLGVDLSIADRLSKMVIIEFGKSKNIDYMIEHDKEFAEILNSTPELKKLTDIVRKLSGIHRGVSTHACGIVITPEPVVEYVPIQKDAHGEGMGMTQYEMFDLEEVGLMKYDFLGLRNLEVIGDTVKMVKRTKKENVDVLKLNVHDKDTYELIKRGNTVGVFQMEGEGMKKVIRSLKPESLEEISYILAAYRPGPLQFIPEYIAVKNGEKKAEYLFPELEPILSITNGVITYQEQVIRIAVDIAGYTMGQADILRKAMGKKIMEIMNKEKPVFVEGAVKKGFDKGKVEELWERLLQFANYGFNKAHSASYAYVTYWTAYLKVHYPIEFMSCLLQGDLDNFNKVVIDMEECKRLGIGVLPPNVNKSEYHFTVENDKDMRFGLAGIKNVGEDISKSIAEERNKNGLFLNFDDFIFRMIDKKISTKAVEYLIKAGACDDFGKREALLNVLPSIMERYIKFKKKQREGQIDLFTGGEKSLQNIENPTVLPEVESISEFQILQWEKELLGLYMSSHPLDEFEEFFEEKKVTKISQLKEMKEGTVVVLGGSISKIRRITTKSNQNMAFVSLEDKSGVIDLVMFPRIYDKSKEELKPNVPTLFAGRVNFRDGQSSVIIEKVKSIDPTQYAKKFTGIVIKFHDEHDENDIIKLKQLIVENPGETCVKIISYRKGNMKSVLLKHKVNLSEELKDFIAKFK